MSTTRFRSDKTVKDLNKDSCLLYEEGMQPSVMHGFTRFYTVTVYTVHTMKGDSFRTGWGLHESHVSFMNSLVKAKEEGKIRSMTFWEEYNRLMITLKEDTELTGFGDVKRVVFHYKA
jgi:hypothetical protein